MCCFCVLSGHHSHECETLFPLAIAHPPDDDNKCVWEGEEEDTCMCVLSAFLQMMTISVCGRERRRIHRYFYSPMVRTERKMGWLRVEG